MTEKDLRHLEDGLTVAVKATAFPDLELDGEIEEISSIPVASGSVFVPGQVASVRSVGARQVALTFDDGPIAPYTDQILSILNRYSVDATFFVVGFQVARGAESLRRAAATGHSVQNHTWDHPTLTRLSSSAIASQLNRTAASITGAIGKRSTCYRPPGGATNDRVRAAAASTGHAPEYLWNVDPSDWKRPASSTLVSRVLSKANGQGLIVGLHDGGGNRANTVAALPSIIQGLKARGYQFVTLCS